ncbi:hypothetical protein Tco_1284634 [Tanacetum coccineum]
MEYSSCGALYNKSCGCSKGGLVDKIVCDPNKTPDSSQRPPQDYVKCGNPVEGPNYQGCALWRKKLKEVWFTICHENRIYQDLLNTYESFDDNTNVVNAPQEPFVVKQDPAFKENSETIIDFNNDSTLSDDDSPYGEDIDYVNASPPDAEIVSLEVVENVIQEVGGIDNDILLSIKDDILREKLLNVNFLIANIEALKNNPTPSSDFVTKSSSTSLNSFLEETNTFDNSIPESETFFFNLEEISSGSTTTYRMQRCSLLVVNASKEFEHNIQTLKCI